MVKIRDRPNAEHVRFCRTEHGRTEHVRFGFETQMFGRTLEDNNSETACRIGFKFWVSTNGPLLGLLADEIASSSDKPFQSYHRLSYGRNLVEMYGRNFRS